jgi:hypothetical protein
MPDRAVEAHRAALAALATAIEDLENARRDTEAVMKSAAMAGLDFSDLLKSHGKLTACLQAKRAEHAAMAFRNIQVGQTVTREAKAENHRESMFRAPMHLGVAPLVERQRGASRERRSARPGARSGDSTDADGSSSDDHHRARYRRAARRSKAP